MILPHFKTILSQTATLLEIAGYIFDNYSGNPEFLEALNNAEADYPAGVREVVDAHDVTEEELIDSLELYIQSC